jgi:hypothetical protein
MAAAQLATPAGAAYSQAVRLIGVTLVLLFALVAPDRAAAQVALTIADGQVTLVAENATVAQILDEWARVGETRFVNGDLVPGSRLTVRLDQVSENEALDVVLQSAAGFLGIAKRAPAPAKSRFDRILILPTTTVTSKPAAAESRPTMFAQPEQQTAPNSPVFPGSEVLRVPGPDGQPLPDDQEGRLPQPRQTRPEFSPPVDVPAPGFPGPRQTDQPDQAPQNPQPPAVSVGVPVPGMVVPAPAPNPERR